MEKNLSNSKAYDQAVHNARRLFKSENYSGAKTFLLTAIQINPDSSEALAMLAWADFQIEGKSNIEVADKCKEMLNKATQLDYENSMAHFYLGKIYKHENNEYQAERSFRRAYSINPDDEEIKHEMDLVKLKKRKNNDFSYRK